MSTEFEGKLVQPFSMDVPDHSPHDFEEWFRDDIAFLTAVGGQADDAPPLVENGSLSAWWVDKIISHHLLTSPNVVTQQNSAIYNFGAILSPDAVQSMYGRQVSWTILQAEAMDQLSRSQDDAVGQFSANLEQSMTNAREFISDNPYYASSPQYHIDTTTILMDNVKKLTSTGDLQAASAKCNELIAVSAIKFASVSDRKPLVQSGFSQE